MKNLNRIATAGLLVIVSIFLAACPPPDRAVHVAWGPTSSQDITCGAVFELFIFDEKHSASGFGSTATFRVYPGWEHDLEIKLENDISENCESVGYTISFEEEDIYFLISGDNGAFAGNIKKGELRYAGEYHSYTIHVPY